MDLQIWTYSALRTSYIQIYESIEFSSFSLTYFSGVGANQSISEPVDLCCCI